MAMIEVNWKPDAKVLRQFGGIALVFFGGFGTWAFFKSSILGFDLSPDTARGVAYTLWALAGYALVGVVAAPTILRPLFVGLTAITLPIGFVISHVVLAIVYYLIMTPIGLVMRLLGRDPMHRKLDPDAKTYWIERPAETPVERYFRQY